VSVCLPPGPTPFGATFRYLPHLKQQSSMYFSRTRRFVAPMSIEGRLQIGEVAETVGMSIRTIRHYDELGVVVSRSRSMRCNFSRIA